MIYEILFEPRVLKYLVNLIGTLGFPVDILSGITGIIGPLL